MSAANDAGTAASQLPGMVTRFDARALVQRIQQTAASLAALEKARPSAARDEMTTDLEANLADYRAQLRLVISVWLDVTELKGLL